MNNPSFSIPSAQGERFENSREFSNRKKKLSEDFNEKTKKIPLGEENLFQLWNFVEKKRRCRLPNYRPIQDNPKKLLFGALKLDIEVKKNYSGHA